MKMGCISKVTFWIYIIYIMNTGHCNEDKVFAITGCNVTLEWRLKITSFEIPLVQVSAFNSSGIRIAQFDGPRSTNISYSPINCKITNRTGELMLSVDLIYVTLVNEGRYTGNIRYGLENEGRNETKHLIIIDKPKIKKPPIIILGMPLNITCTIGLILDNVNYQWKLNETDLNTMGRIYARSSTLMFESFWMVDKSSVFACEVCQGNSCCIQSETFVLDPYSPTSLEHNDDASTAPSGLEHTDGPQLKLLGLGLTILAVVLTIIGFSIFLLLRRKYLARKPDTSILHQPLVEPANRENCRQFFNFEKYNRPIPIPSVQENVCTRIKRSRYPNGQRKSRSLQTLLDRTSDYFSPAWKSMSLIELSHMIGRRATSDDSLSTLSHSKKDSRFNAQSASNRIRLDEHC